MERIISLLKADNKEKVGNSLLLASFLSVLFVFSLFSKFLQYNEGRIGSSIKDPVLEMLIPADYNILIFLLTYGLILLGLSNALNSRPGILMTNLSICFLIAFRALTIFLFPLEPPACIIPLEDVLLKNTFYGQNVLLKDLFFSGHTAAISLLYFLTNHKWIKISMAIGACLIGFLLMNQHVHYTIDIFAAPFFSWASFHCAFFTKKVITMEQEIESLEIQSE